MKGSRNLSPSSRVGSTLNMGGQIVNEEPKNDNYSIFYTFRSPKIGWALSNNFLHPCLCEKRPSTSMDFFAKLNISMKSWNLVPISCCNFLLMNSSQILEFVCLFQKLFQFKIWLTYSKWCWFPTIHEVNY